MSPARALLEAAPGSPANVREMTVLKTTVPKSAILALMGTVLRIPPTQSQLDEMLHEHLSFEINRFRLAVSMWGQQNHGGLVDAMVRESCLIHMRLLLDFFYPRIDLKKSKFEDVFVSDYLPNPTQLPKPLQKLLTAPPWLQDYRDQLDWRLAHMTMKRMAFKKHRRLWEPQKQFAHLESLISGFIAALPEKTRVLFNPNQR